MNLKNTLVSNGFSDGPAATLAKFVEGQRNVFLFPRSVALRLSLPLEETAQMLTLLAAKGLLIHFVVPKYKGQALTSFANQGFELTTDQIQDPTDFMPVDPNDVERISAFKLRPNE